ncbi:MAG TPA: hypothetical protein VFT60_04985 [Bryobacteraceae bacterium]|nr:hypothetical protein [Bryobacteraceae bacterium]
MGLKCAEFGEGAVEQAVGLRAGAIDGLLGSGIGRGIGFDFAATAEAPESASNFGGKTFFDRTGGA